MTEEFKPDNLSLYFLFLGAVVTFAATGLGALPALATRKLSNAWKGVLIGFSSGVMLAASAFTLILPAFEMWESQGLTKSLSAGASSLAVLGGAILLAILNNILPHEHFETGVEGAVYAKSLQRVWLFVLAITLHNFPEGLAVGTGIGSQDASIALPILIGIGIQNIPEGFIVAFSLLAVGYKAREAMGVALLTGFVEALSAGLGYVAVTSVLGFLPWALAMAGGAMIYVVGHEMIPESHAKSQSAFTTGGLMLGFVLMFMISMIFTAS